MTESNGRSVHQRSDHPIYVELQSFRGVHRPQQALPEASSFPATVAFLTWYLLYV